MHELAILLGPVLLASLLGSLHCAGMCGGFVAFYAADTNPGSRGACHAAYSAGRLASYTLLGAGAGLVGASIDLAGSMAGVQRTAGIGAGLLIVGWGVLALFPGRLSAWLHRVAPRSLARLAAGGVRRLRALPPVRRALGLGLLSTLLPCGWLYAFALVAAGTGSPAVGAVVMATFWVGTVPVLVGLGVGVQTLAAPLRARLPLLTGLALVMIGVVTVLGRVEAIGRAPAAPLSARLSDPTAAPAALRELETHELPCCQHR